MKGPKKRNVFQQANRAAKVVAKKLTDAQVEKIIKEDAERADREVKRQELLEYASARITHLSKQRRLFAVTTAFFVITTIIAGVL
jgi:DNA polymerase III delta subunit